MKRESHFTVVVIEVLFYGKGRLVPPEFFSIEGSRRGRRPQDEKRLKGEKRKGAPMGRVTKEHQGQSRDKSAFTRTSKLSPKETGTGYGKVW